MQIVYWMHCRMQLQYSTELMGGVGGGGDMTLTSVSVAVFVCTWACVCKIHSSDTETDSGFLGGGFVKLLCTFTLLNGLNIHSLSLFIVVD